MRRAAVKVIKESLSSTIAANFQSFSIASSSSSAFNLSVRTRSSLRIIVNSLMVPDGSGVTFSGSKKGSSFGDLSGNFLDQHSKQAISENLFVLQKTFVTNKLCRNVGKGQETKK